MRKLIFILFIMTSCSQNVLRNKYFKTPSPTYVTEIHNDQNLRIDTINLDATYNLYVRQICRLAPPTNFYTLANPKISSAVDMCNCEDLKVERNKMERLEIEYLIYSSSRGNVIYITTIPPQMVKQGRDFISLYDQPLFDLDSLANINYFNTFFFGKVEQDTIKIKNSAVDSSEWKMSISANQESIVFDHLNYRSTKDVYSTNPADDLSLPIKFYRKRNWEMILNDRVEDTEIVDDHNNRLEEKVIYIYSDKRRPGKADKVWFHFNTSYSWPGYAERYDLFFQSGRIKSSPSILFEND